MPKIILNFQPTKNNNPHLTMNYFWMGFIATIAYSAGYFRGMWLMSADRHKRVKHYEEILGNYSRFLDDYNQFLKEKGIQQKDDQ